MPSTTLDIRLQALDWLVAATRHWLFQGQASALEFPCGNDVDWKTVGDLAYFHNLEPILYWVVSNNDSPTGTPEWLKQRWEKAYFENFLKNEGYLDVLKVILNKCAEKGVPVIVLKGPALIGRIYKDAALRTMADLDILCSPDDLRQLINIASDMGYTIMAAGDDAPSTHHVTMNQAASGTILEFHFMPYEDIQNHNRFMQLAWQRKKLIRVNEFLCPVLPLEMALVFNVTHIIQHQFDVSLKHYLDIAGLLIFFGKKLNWDEIHSILMGTNLEHKFILTVRFISHILGRPILPQEPWLKNGKVDQQEFDSSLQALLALLNETRLMDVIGFVWNFRIALANRKGFGDKLVFVRNGLFSFLGDLAPPPQYGPQSKRNVVCFYSHRFLFYLQLFLKGQLTPAIERAAAKNRITTQLSGVGVEGPPGKETNPRQTPFLAGRDV